MELSEEAIKNLKSLSFTDEEIMNMSQEEFEFNEGLVGEELETTTTYSKIIENIPPATDLSKNQRSTSIQSSSDTVEIELDKETYYEELKNINNESSDKISTFSTTTDSDSTSTSYKKMTTIINKLGTNKYRVKNYLRWDKMPANRKTDVLGVGINSAFWAPVKGSGFANTSFTTYSKMYGTTSKSFNVASSNNKWNKGAGGYSINLSLPQDDRAGGAYNTTVRTLSHSMYYTVTPLAYSNRLDAYGHFAHQETLVGISPSVSLSGFSFSISNSTKFTYQASTHATVYK